MTPRRRPARAAALLATAALSLGALTACGGSSDDAPGRSAPSVPASEPFNDADVAFATEMIPHHAQALAMVDLTRGRELSPPVERLAQEILDAQGPEIQTMAGWLQDWDQPIPATMRDHVNAEDHGGMDMGEDSTTDPGSDMPGMMSEQELADLESAPDADFESRWLRLMVEHHEGAIRMARAERSRGEYAEARALAGTIASGQQREITRMQALLAG